MKITDSDHSCGWHIFFVGWLVLGAACGFFLLGLSAEIRNLADFFRIMEPVLKAGNPEFCRSTWLEYGMRRSVALIPRVVLSVCTFLLGYDILRRENRMRGMGWYVCMGFFLMGEIIFGLVIILAFIYSKHVVSMQKESKNKSENRIKGSL
jgi:uncharacterized membrane protein